MEKIIALVLASVLASVYGVWYFSVAPQTVSPEVSTAISHKSALTVKTEESKEVHSVEKSFTHMTQKEMYERVKSSCEGAGWLVTEFKNNAIIAEKIDGADSISTTIKFDSSSFTLSPENSELSAIIESALKE